MKDKNIGFIGLGNVGAKLANSILVGGYNLFINDLNKPLATARLTTKKSIILKNKKVNAY